MDKNWKDNWKDKGEDRRPEAAAASAAVGSEFGIDPDEDPELALALQLSMEERHQQKQLEEDCSVVPKSSSGASLSLSTSQVQHLTSSGTTSTPKTEDEISEIAMLQQAINMSLETTDVHQIGNSTAINTTTTSRGYSTTTRTGTSSSIPNKTIPDLSNMTEEEQIAWAMQVFTEFCGPDEEAKDVDLPENSELLLPTSEIARKNQALKDAVCGGDVAAVQKVLALGANPHILCRNDQDQCLSLLSLAAFYGHIEVVRHLMAAGVNPEGPGEPNPTALHAAATKGHSDIMTILLEAEVSKEARIHDGNTALILAANNGHTTCVLHLLVSGADINASCSHGRTPLHGASENGNIDGVKILLEYRANISAKDNDGDTPLMIAASSGHIEILKELLEAGANINDKSSNGNTSLHYASGFGHIDAVKLLVKAGADKTILNNVNCTPLDVAARTGNCQVLEYLMGVHGTDPGENDGGLKASVLAQWKGDALTSWLLGKHEGRLLNPDDSSDMALTKQVHQGDVTAVKRSLALGANPHIRWLDSGDDDQHLSLLNAAVAYGHLDVVRLLMASGVSLESRPGKLDTTALHSAVFGDHSDIVTLLLEAGANLEAKIINGNTALHLAAEEGYAAIVHQLLHAGADVNPNNFQKETPLHSAAGLGHTEVLRELLEAGANINGKTDDGDSPLHIAAFNGQVVATKILLEADANINDTNNDRRTPLHLAAYRGHVDAVKELVKAGAAINDKDSQGHTSLHYAAFSGQVDAWKVLVEAGGDVRIPNNSNVTPLDYAVAFGSPEMIESFAGEEEDEIGTTASATAKLIGHAKTLWRKRKQEGRASNPDSLTEFPLKDSVCEGDVAAVELALALGADTEITWKNPDNVCLSLLTAAACYGHIEIVRLLMEAGLTLEGPGNLQPTALHLAALHGHSDMVTFLLEAGADLEARIEIGNTALHMAAQNSHAISLHQLLVYGADVNAATVRGVTPLHFAAWNGDVDSLKELLATGANKSHKNIDGRTPLEYAAWKGRVGALTELLKAGANTTDKDKDGMTPLHSAAHNGHAEAVKVLLKADADITDKNNNGKTPLHSAAWNGHVDVVKTFLEAGANTRDKSKEKDTPLHMAAYNGHVDVVNELLKAGANVSDKNNVRLTSLHMAAYKGHVDTVKALLKAGASVNDKDNDGHTALHPAAASGHVGAVKELLEAGAHKNATSTDGKTPLHLAAGTGHVDVVIKLLDAGADISATSRNGNTTLHFTAASGHVDVVQVLLDAGASVSAKNEYELTALHFAASNGHADVVKKLLQAGSNISAKSSNGKTPLHLAAWSGHINAVKELIKAGAKIGDKDRQGDTPLHWVAVTGHVDVVKELLEAGANVNDKDDSGNTPLHLIARNGHVDAEKEVLKADVNINDKRDDGQTPLHLAASSSNVDSLKVLLEVGANINAKDNNGSTSLHIASHYGRAEALKELLEAGADMNERDNNGDTLLHMATQSGHIHVAKMLGEAGSDIKVRNHFDLTPMHYAISYGGREMVEFLVKHFGCKPEEDDVKGLTATDFAELRGDANTFWWLKKHLGDLANPDSSRDLGRGWSGIEEKLSAVKEYIDSGQIDQILNMIPRVIDGHVQDHEGMTFIHWAAKLGYDSRVHELITECGMYPFVKTYKGETPADLAEQQGHTMVIKTLNNVTPPQINSTKEGLYEKLLEVICSGDDVKQAGDLLWAGSPLTPVGRFATEALTLAMEWNRSRILSLLVAAGAPLTTTTCGLSILNRTFRNPDIAARTRAFIHRAYFHKLRCEKWNVADHKELRDGLEQIVKKLLMHKGCSKSSRAHWPSNDNKVLSKLLTEAARRNCPLICSLLYQAGGKAFLGKGDESPITVAIENQHWEVLKVLVCNIGACPYVYNSEGDLSLLKMPVLLQHEIEQIVYDKERRKLEIFHESRRNDKEKEMARKLLSLQEALFSHYQSTWDEDTRTLGPPQAFAAAGNTIIPLPPETCIAGLSIATKRGLPQLIFLLVKVGGTDVDTVLDNTMGTTSLQQAASIGKGECVGILLGLGSNPSRPDHYGHSALHLAAMSGHKDVYHCLLQYTKYNYYTCRSGTTPENVCSGFERYLRSYKKCGQRSVENEDINLCTDATEATEKLLDCIDWGQLLNESERIRMDFTKGEAKTVKDAVMNELRIMCDTVEEARNIFKGELRLGGSSSDGTKLYCPDEIDVNLILDKNLLSSIEVVDQEDKELFNSGHKKVFKVETDNPYLKDDNLMNEFHDLIQKYLEDHRLVNINLSLVPPGVTKTQVGVALHLAWQGKEYPLLLIGVDLVPVVEVPWIEKLSRPFLTPPGRDTFHISNTSDGFWRGSFAEVEAAVLKQLDSQELKVYLICKILLSCMKPEPWMSVTKKNLYTWWSHRDWRISMPTTFALKNAFFRCLERKRKLSIEWPEEKLLQWVSQVFGEMCRDYDPLSDNLECREHTKIRPYFAEDFQQPKNGAGAPEIVRYLSKMM